MNFIISKSKMLEALNVANKAIAPSKVIPILENFLFQAVNDSLIVSGSNGEISISVIIKIEGEGPAESIAIPATKLLTLIKELPEQPLAISLDTKDNDDNSLILKIKAETGEYIFPITSGLDFPKITVVPDISFNIASSDLKDGIHATAFALHTDQLNILRGLFLYLDGNQITFTGCNYFVLSTITVNAETDFTKQIILPSKVLSVLQSLNFEGEILISVAKNNVAFEFGGIMIKSVLINESYPDYKTIIPTNGDKFLCVNRNELIGALKRISQFSDQGTQVIQMDITEKKFTVNTNNNLGDLAYEELLHKYEGNPITIGVNYKYLLGALTNMNSNDAHFSFSNPQRAMLIRGEKVEEQTKNNLMLVMPFAR